MVFDSNKHRTVPWLNSWRKEAPSLQGRSALSSTLFLFEYLHPVWPSALHNEQKHIASPYSLCPYRVQSPQETCLLFGCSGAVRKNTRRSTKRVKFAPLLKQSATMDTPIPFDAIRSKIKSLKSMFDKMQTQTTQDYSRKVDIGSSCTREIADRERERHRDEQERNGRVASRQLGLTRAPQRLPEGGETADIKRARGGVV